MSGQMRAIARMTGLNLVAYERIGLANPVSETEIGEALNLTDLGPGDRAAELGCGNATLAMLIARRGLDVLAVDRGEAMAALAARKVAAAGLSDRVTVVHDEAEAAAGRHGPFRLVSAVGTTALTDFLALASWIEPGGWLLWGDLFWKERPKVQLAGGGMDYDTDEGWRERGRAAGLSLMHARISDDADWAAHVDDLKRAAADWAAENPDHPQRRLVEMRADTMAAMYAPENLRSLGFVLYLFRKPD